MIAAQPLHGEDPAVGEQFGGPRQRLALQDVPGRVRSVSRGPQAGQQVGWAWKRRSPGSWYSAAHGSHIANAAMVVIGRS